MPKIPNKVVLVCSKNISDWYTHRKIDYLFEFYEAPQQRGVLAGNKYDKVSHTLKSANRLAGYDALDLLAKFMADYMDEDPQTLGLNGEALENGQNEVRKILREHGLSYEAGGRLLPFHGSVAPPKLIAPIDAASAAFINEQVDKCCAKLAGRDYDGAITNARSMLESVISAMVQHLSGESPKDTGGDLGRLYKQLRPLLNLERTKDLETPLQQVLSGLTSIVAGIAGLRNKMSDSHKRSYKPGEHHARLVVNAANTFAQFLWDTYEYQVNRGAIQVPGETV